MGYPIAVYGVKFSYNEALLIKKSADYKEAEKKYKDDYGITEDLEFDTDYSVFLNAWDKIGQWILNDTVISFRADKKYSYSLENESDYFVGICIVKENIEYIQQLNLESAKQLIRHVCNEVGLPYSNKEIKLYYSVFI